MGNCRAVNRGPPMIPGPATTDKPARGNPGPKKSRFSIPVVLAAVVLLIAGIGGLVAVVYLVGSRANKAADHETFASQKETPESATTLPPLDEPPSKFDAYNDTPNAANAAQPTKLAPNSDAMYRSKVVGVWRVRKIVLGALVDVDRKSVV